MPTHAQRLVRTVRIRNYEGLRELLSRPGSVAVTTAAGRTALHAAAEDGDFEAARILIGAGADLMARMQNGKTPLHLAAGQGLPCDLRDPDVERRNPFKRGRHRKTNAQVAKVLTELIKERCPDVPRDLGPMDNFPEENKIDLFIETLHIFADSAKLLQELLKKGIDLDAVDPDFAEQLRGNPRYLRVVELLLDNGADASAIDKHGVSVLQSAVEYARPEMVELLLKHGGCSQISESPTGRRGLVDFALQRNQVKIARLLVSHGTKFEPSNHGRLHEAAGNGRMEALTWLLEIGGHIEARDEAGNTPLLSAARNGHSNAIALLVSKGGRFARTESRWRFRATCRRGL